MPDTAERRTTLLGAFLWQTTKEVAKMVPVEVEVIREVPVEVIREVEKEVIREVIREVRRSRLPLAHSSSGRNTSQSAQAASLQARRCAALGIGRRWF